MIHNYKFIIRSIDWYLLLFREDIIYLQREKVTSQQKTALLQVAVTLRTI